MSYGVDIAKFLGSLGDKYLVGPDAKHNTGKLIQEAYMWDAIAKYAEKQSEAAWGKLERFEIIPPADSLDPGDHHLADSPSFAVTCEVTMPVKRLDTKELARLLAASKHKVPVSATVEFLEAAKLPAKPTRRYKITERG